MTKSTLCFGSAWPVGVSGNRFTVRSTNSRVPSRIAGVGVKAVVQWRRRSSRQVGAAAVWMSASLEDFVAGACGEWAGSEASYSGATGELVPPSSFCIPDEFLEWNVSPMGFQSHQAMTLRSGNILWRKHFRIFPSVSTFGDHLDLEENEFEIKTDDPGFSYFSDCGGSYIMSPPVVRVRESRLERHPTFEFVLAQNPIGSPKDRARTLLRFKFDYETREIEDELQLIDESYDSEFRNGSALDGSSGFSAGIGEEGCSNASEMLAETLGWADVIPPKHALPEDWRSGKAASTCFGFPRGLYLLIGNGTEDELVFEFGRVWSGYRECLVRRYSISSGEHIGTERVVTSRVASLDAKPFLTAKASDAAESAAIAAMPRRATVEPVESLDSLEPLSGRAAEFAAWFEGEWTGSEASFDPITNEMLPIPEEYIPEEFIEWGVVPMWFESSQATTIRRSKEGEASVWRKHYRLVPMSGDDAELEESVYQHPLDGANFVYQARGGYVTGPMWVGASGESSSQDSGSVEFEFCIGLERRDGEDVRERAVGRASINVKSWCFSGPIQMIVEEYRSAFAEGAGIDGSEEVMSRDWGVSEEAQSTCQAENDLSGQAVALARGVYLWLRHEGPTSQRVAVFEAGLFRQGTRHMVGSLRYIPGQEGEGGRGGEIETSLYHIHTP